MYVCSTMYRCTLVVCTECEVCCTRVPNANPILVWLGSASAFFDQYPIVDWNESSDLQYQQHENYCSGSVFFWTSYELDALLLLFDPTNSCLNFCSIWLYHLLSLSPRVVVQRTRTRQLHALHSFQFFCCPPLESQSCSCEYTFSPLLDQPIHI